MSNEALIAEAREWSGSYASWGDNGLVDRLVDALEATTRVPAQGEPSDDRETILAIMNEVGLPHDPYFEDITDAILVAGFSRATVPDAATSERDAALAVIERVKETLSLHNPNGRLVKEVLAALDGHPNPRGSHE